MLTVQCTNGKIAGIVCTNVKEFDIDGKESVQINEVFDMPRPILHDRHVFFHVLGHHCRGP